MIFVKTRQYLEYRKILMESQIHLDMVRMNRRVDRALSRGTFRGQWHV